MARGAALAAAIAASLLVVSGAGGAATQQTPKRGGTVVFGPVGEAFCLNPLACGSDVDEMVLTPAFAVAPDLTEKPRLVSSATYTRKPPFTITYRIRREARWSDGVPVTARDFDFTHHAIQRALAKDPDSIHIPAIHGRVLSTRRLDAKTFRVVLRSREAGWRSLFRLVLPAHALRGEDLDSVWSDRIVNPKTGRPIGNGPFLLERWERGKQFTLVRNPNYWGPHLAYLDRLVMRFRQRAGGTAAPLEVLEGLHRGEVDFSFSQDPSFVSDLRRVPGIRVFHTSFGGWEHLDIRQRPEGHPALQNKLVRRAVAYGIDRVAIVRRLYAELDPTYPPSDSVVLLRSHASYRSNWNAYRYRPSESRRLLERAGCGRGTDGIYVCAGKKLQLRLMTTAGVSHRVRTIDLVTTQLRRAGIEAIPVYVPAGVLFQQILPSGDYDLAVYLHFVPADASGKKGAFGCGGLFNHGGYCQRLLTKDLDQADRILDADRRARVLNRADGQLAKDVPVIPLYEGPYVLALRKTVRNVLVSFQNLFWNVEDWWLAR